LNDVYQNRFNLKKRKEAMRTRMMIGQMRVEGLERNVGRKGKKYRYEMDKGRQERCR
jgi:hypothetical protein